MALLHLRVGSLTLCSLTPRACLSRASVARANTIRYKTADPEIKKRHESVTPNTSSDHAAPVHYAFLAKLISNRARKTAAPVNL